MRVCPICNSHRIKHRLTSTGLPLGVDADSNPHDMLQYAPLADNDKILMYSDGLIEARDSEDCEFGNKRLIDAIAMAPQDQIFDHLFTALDGFCRGRAQADDVTLVEITCVDDLLPANRIPLAQKPAVNRARDQDDWKLSLRFDSPRLRATNPVPVLANYLMEMEALDNERQALFTVLTELYSNALDHGVLALDSALKNDPAGFEKYSKIRESRLSRLDSGFVLFDLTAEQRGDQRSILLRVEDSGEGFDFTNLASSASVENALSGRGLILIRELCESLEFAGQGNIAIARFSWHSG